MSKLGLSEEEAITVHLAATIKNTSPEELLKNIGLYGAKTIISDSADNDEYLVFSIIKTIDEVVSLKSIDMENQLSSIKSENYKLRKKVDESSQGTLDRATIDLLICGGGFILGIVFSAFLFL